jgi:hypothetical protein
MKHHALLKSYRFPAQVTIAFICHGPVSQPRYQRAALARLVQLELFLNRAGIDARILHAGHHQIASGVHQVVFFLYHLTVFIPAIDAELSEPIAKVAKHFEAARRKASPDGKYTGLNAVVRIDQLKRHRRLGVHLSELLAISLVAPCAGWVYRTPYPRPARLNRISMNRRLSMAAIMFAVKIDTIRLTVPSAPNTGSNIPTDIKTISPWPMVGQIKRIDNEGGFGNRINNTRSEDWDAFCTSFSLIGRDRLPQALLGIVGEMRNIAPFDLNTIL